MNSNDNNNSSRDKTSDNDIISNSGFVISELGPYDVLLGRGTGPNENQGNKRFRELLKEVIAKYKHVCLETSKAQITYDVLGTLKACNGRFVRKLTKEESLAFYALQQEQEDMNESAGRDQHEGGLRGRSFEKSKKKLKKNNRPLYVIVPDSVASEKTKQSIRFQIKTSQASCGSSSSCSSATVSSSAVTENTNCKTMKKSILPTTQEELQQKKFLSSRKLQQKERANFHSTHKIVSKKKQMHLEQYQKHHQNQNQSLSKEIFQGKNTHDDILPQNVLQEESLQQKKEGTLPRTKEAERNGLVAIHSSPQREGHTEKQRNEGERNRPTSPSVSTEELLEQRYARMCLMLAQQDEERARRKQQEEAAAFLSAATTAALANAHNTTMEGILSSLPARYLTHLLASNGIPSALVDHPPIPPFPSTSTTARINQEDITSLALLEWAAKRQQLDNLPVDRRTTAPPLFGSSSSTSTAVFPTPSLGVFSNSSLPLSETDLNILRRIANGTVLQEANIIASQPQSWRTENQEE